MATIAPSYTEIVDTKGGLGNTVALKVVWVMANGDVGLPISQNLALFVDRTFQAEGTFGGGTVTVEGANDDDGSGAVGNFHTLNDPFANLITLTQSGIRQVTEAVVNMRPHVAGGNVGTSLTVTALLRRSVR